MLAEIAAANTAIATIKEFLANGQDLASLGPQLAKFFDATAEIESIAQEEGRDSEVFFQLEGIREKERDIFEWMIYVGRPGLVDDWWKHKATRKKERDAKKHAALAKAARRRQALYNTFVAVLVGLTGITGVGVIGLIAYVIWKSKI